MQFLALPLRNLRRRPGRALFAAVGISMAVAVYSSMTVLFGDIVRGWEEDLTTSGVHALILQDRQIDWLASSVPQKLAREIEKLEPVRAASGELLSFLTTSNGDPILAAGWARSSRHWDRLHFISGTRPDFGPQVTATIGETAATALGVHTGDQLDLDGLRVTVSGIFEASGTLMDNRLIMPLNALQEHMFREGVFTDLQITFKRPGDPTSLATVSDYINRNYSGLAVRPTEQLTQDNRIVELLTALRHAVIWIASFAGIAGTANIMLMAVNERRTEVGLLIAVGWSPARIVLLFLLEAVFLASLAGVAGIVIGKIIIELVSQNAALAGFLSVSMTPAVALHSFTVAVGIGAISAILPALRAARIPADAALRSI